MVNALFILLYCVLFLFIFLEIKKSVQGDKKQLHYGIGKLFITLLLILLAFVLILFLALMFSGKGIGGC
jgi:hypothetical protein